MKPAGAKREILRATFDSIADKYQMARPDYPPELFDDLVKLARLSQSADLLEIGCGPGKATIPLAERGFTITAIELGPALADAARRNVEAFPKVEVVRTTFEEWSPPQGFAIELVYAATAWPWIDPDVKYRKAAQLLRPGGHLAVWSARHAFPADLDPFFTEIQNVYEEIGESHDSEWPPPPPEDVPDETVAFVESGYFDVAGVRRYLWAVDYGVDRYIDLLDTFSDHRAMEPAKRHYLYEEIRRRIGTRPSKTIRRHWLAVLTIGRRRRWRALTPTSPSMHSRGRW